MNAELWRSELDGVEAALQSPGLSPRDERSLRSARAGLRFAAQADWERASLHLERAGALAPRRAWPWVLRSAVGSSAGDWGGAKDALLKAISREPSAAQFARLAKLYEYLGILPRAIEAASSAIAREPSAQHYALKAELLLCWREHISAAENYTLALTKDPDNAALFFSRSQAYSSAGRLAEALDDARQAVLLAPGSVEFQGWVVELLIQTAKSAEARAMIKKAKLGAFYSGYERLVARDYAAAAKAFSSSKGMKADFYKTVAVLLGEPAPARDDARVLLAGLGVNPPYSASSEALRALADCDVLFNNIPGHENFELLRALCRECRPLAYHQANDEEKLCAEMLHETRRGLKVGFVTRGCATVYGPLGNRLLKYCRAEGVAFRDFAAVSSAESLMARFGGGSLLRGMGVFDGGAREFSRKASRRVPVTVFLDMKGGAARFRRLTRRLAADYGNGHEVLVLDHVIGQEPQRVRAAALADWWPKLSPSAILYLPPLRS